MVKPVNALNAVLKSSPLLSVNQELKQHVHTDLIDLPFKKPHCDLQKKRNIFLKSLKSAKSFSFFLLFSLVRVNFFVCEEENPPIGEKYLLN